jgi:hypothetical protein
VRKRITSYLARKIARFFLEKRMKRRRSLQEPLLGAALYLHQVH